MRITANQVTIARLIGLPDDGIEVSEAGSRQDTPLEDRSDNRLVDECRARGELTARV